MKIAKLTPTGIPGIRKLLNLIRKWIQDSKISAKGKIKMDYRIIAFYVLDLVRISYGYLMIKPPAPASPDLHSPASPDLHSPALLGAAA